MKNVVNALHEELKIWTASRRDWILLVTGLILTLFLVVFFLDKNMGYGLGLGFWGFCGRFGIYLFALAYSAGVCALIFYFRPGPSIRISLLYALMVFISTTALDLVLLKEADDQWQFGEYLVQQKIEYHCLKRFNDRQCVTLIHSFPKSAVQIDKWKRDQISFRLKSVSRTLASVPARSSR